MLTDEFIHEMTKGGVIFLRAEETEDPRTILYTFTLEEGNGREMADVRRAMLRASNSREFAESVQNRMMDDFNMAPSWRGSCSIQNERRVFEGEFAHFRNPKCTTHALFV